MFEPKKYSDLIMVHIFIFWFIWLLFFDSPVFLVHRYFWFTFYFMVHWHFWFIGIFGSLLFSVDRHLWFNIIFLFNDFFFGSQAFRFTILHFYVLDFLLVHWVFCVYIFHVHAYWQCIFPRTCMLAIYISTYMHVRTCKLSYRSTQRRKS